MINANYIRSYNSIYRGVVEDNIDPEGLGRCKIRVPSVHGELTYPVEILPWARPIVLSPVKSNKGSVNIPDIGDIVWVLFEGAVKDFPVYFGGTYATDEISIDNDIVDFYIEEDSRISYNRRTDTYSIKVKDKHIIISPESLSLVGDVTIVGNLHVLGKIIAEEDVTGKSISLVNHIHGGVFPGVGNTNTPK